MFFGCSLILSPWPPGEIIQRIQMICTHPSHKVNLSDMAIGVFARWHMDSRSSGEDVGEEI